MANICCDDVCFFSDENPEGIASLWKDLETAITPGYKDDLGSVRHLFLHAGIATDGISLRGTIIDMKKNDTRILLSLDTAWRPLYDAYTAIANTYGVSFVMRSMEPGCGIFYNTDDTGSTFPDRYCVTGETSIDTPCGIPLEEKVDYGTAFSSENALMETFHDLGYPEETLEALAGTLDGQGVYIHSYINPYL